MAFPLDLWSPAEARLGIPAPPPEVYDVLADPTTYPEWLVGAQRIRSVDPAFPAPGAEFDHSVGPTEATTVDDSSTALAAEPPHRLVLEVHVGPLRGLVELLVLPAPGGSEVRFRERPAGWAAVLTPLVRPLIHGRNVESLRQLREYVTAGRPTVGAVAPIVEKPDAPT